MKTTCNNCGAEARPGKVPPLPWEGGRAPEEPDTGVFGSQGVLFGRVVGTPDYPAAAKLDLLLRAVNSHADLLEQLRAAVELFADYCEPNDMDAYVWIYHARAALARAEGGGG